MVNIFFLLCCTRTQSVVYTKLHFVKTYSVRVKYEIMGISQIIKQLGWLWKDVLYLVVSEMTVVVTAVSYFRVDWTVVVSALSYVKNDWSC